MPAINPSLSPRVGSRTELSESPSFQLRLPIPYVKFFSGFTDIWLKEERYVRVYTFAHNTYLYCCGYLWHKYEWSVFPTKKNSWRCYRRERIFETIPILRNSWFHPYPCHWKDLLIYTSYPSSFSSRLQLEFVKGHGHISPIPTCLLSRKVGVSNFSKWLISLYLSNIWRQISFMFNWESILTYRNIW